ncbi:MAG TPA: hypothetical protein VFZ28_02810 [Burkholderiaceae bacterium]|nr:hypothetical protein [Burkholderiaceae bacterium]
MNDIANAQARNAAAGAAIARVLGAERDARDSIAAAQAEVTHIGEEARAATRAISERTEHRLRRVVECIERDTAARLAAIDANAAALAEQRTDVAGDDAVVRAAVAALASRLIGAAS